MNGLHKNTNKNKKEYESAQKLACITSVAYNVAEMTTTTTTTTTT